MTPQTQILFSIALALLLGGLNTFAMRYIYKKLSSQDPEMTQTGILAAAFLGKMVVFFGGAWLMMQYLPIHLLAFGATIVVWMFFSTFLLKKLEAQGTAKNGS